MMDFADPKRQTLNKRRDNFIYDGNYYRLETFEDKKEWPAILRVDTDSDSSSLNLPPFLEVIEEVTENSKYFSVNLSRKDFKP